MGKFFITKFTDEQDDVEYNFSRVLQTLVIIFIIFTIAFVLKSNYFDLLENSRFLQFYPENTVLYQDFSSYEDFDVMKLPANMNYKSISYGIFKDAKEQDKFLIVAKTDSENLPITDFKNYSSFVDNGYVFFSDSESELFNIKSRIKTKRYEFLKNSELKKVIKKTDKTRNSTIIVSDLSYVLNFVPSKQAAEYNIFFDKAIIQVFKTENGVAFEGTVILKNNILNILSGLKKISGVLTNKSIKIKKFDTQKSALIFAAKDFDVWSKTFMHVSKTLPDNKYCKTVKLIETTFNSNLEEDIVDKLDGNAVLYFFKEKGILQPVLTLDTKQSLDEQFVKYFNFLQLKNNSAVSQKEIHNKTFNVITSGVYPHSLSFGSIDNNLFIFGHQNIIEKYFEETNDFQNEKCDFYIYSQVKNTPFLNKNKGFWSDYKELNMKVTLAPSIKFTGEMFR